MEEMNPVEGYWKLLIEIYGDDVVKECIKKKNELLYINKESIYFSRGSDVPKGEVCRFCLKNVPDYEYDKCKRALPGWEGPLDLSKGRKYFVLSQAPNPDRALVTSYRVGLRHDSIYDPNCNYCKIKNYLEGIIPDFKIEDAYLTDAVKCNLAQPNDISELNKKYWSYLCREIWFIKPQRVIAHGIDALDALTELVLMKDQTGRYEVVECSGIKKGEKETERGFFTISDGISSPKKIEYLKIPHKERSRFLVKNVQELKNAIKDLLSE